MRHVNKELFYKIPRHFRGIMEYYPDVSLFDLNQIQYTRLWHQIHTSQYLYSNGYQIRPTNWFMYAFQSFKGWLGFDNHCHPEKISYTLNKLAYYGYSRRLSQPQFSLMTRYSLSPEICALAVNEYADSNTRQLQSELIKSYFKVEPHLDINYTHQRLSANHRFGDSWVTVGELEQVPLLDPQDNRLIAEVIRALDQKGTPVIEFLKDSRYAHAAAQYYYNKARNTPEPSFFSRLLWSDPRPGFLTQALVYDPEIAAQDPLRFIEYYLGKHNYHHAFNLLDLLNDPKMILKFLLAMPEPVRDSLVQKDSPLAAILAQYYIETRQYSNAQRFYSDIESLSPEASFVLAIKENEYVKAYELFKRLESSSSFSMTDRKTLATFFFNAAEKEYELGKTLRDNKSWDEAGQHYFRSLVQKKAAHHLNPSMEYLEDVYTHKRLYSMLLIDADVDSHKPEESDIADIQKALALLRECHSRNKEEQQHQTNALAAGLMRRVDTLREKICFTYTPHDHSDLREHKVKYQVELSALIKTLEELIDLLKGTKDKDLRLKLGKAYYLLADVKLFFDINDSDINQNYKMAMNTVPENPFYVLRVGEVFEVEKDKLFPIGITALKKMGYTSLDYYHWFNERWVKKDHVIHEIKDIHQPELEPVKTSRWALEF